MEVFSSAPQLAISTQPVRDFLGTLLVAMFDLDELDDMDPAPECTGGLGSGASLWEVMPTAPAQGIFVRTGQDPSSPESSGGRLKPGSIVAELAGDGDRIRYTLLIGSGPKDGWVSTSIRGQILMARLGEKGTSTYASAVPNEIRDSSQDPVVWILGCGSRGDYQPLVALAVGLKGVGYKPRLFGEDSIRGMAESQDILFTTMGPSLEEVTGGLAAEAKKKAEDQSVTIDRFKKLQDEAKTEGKDANDLTTEQVLDVDLMGPLMTFLNEENTKMKARVLLDALKVETPRIVLYCNLVGFVAFLVWKQCGAAILKIDFFPDLYIGDPNNRTNLIAENNDPDGNFRRTFRWLKEETGSDPGLGMSGEDIFEWQQQCSRCFVEGSMVESMAKPGNFPSENFDKWREAHSRGPLIMDVTRQLKDMSFFGGSENLNKMQAFLEDSGDKPCFYVGWGSMPITADTGFKMMVVLLYCKWRCIFCKGCSDITQEACIEKVDKLMPGDPMGVKEFMKTEVCWVAVAPHEWLMPRCCTTIHHGGAGTTHAALRAGVPTIITAFGMDQDHFAEWVVQNEWGSKFSLYSNLTNAIDPAWIKPMDTCSSSKAMKERCKANGEYFRTIDSIALMKKDFDAIVAAKKDQSPGSEGLLLGR